MITTPANAVRLSKNDFMFHLIGFERNLMYNARAREVYMTNAYTGCFLYVVSKNEVLTYEEFDMTARDMWLTLLESSN